jgi:two-component sensor histidine kinase
MLARQVISQLELRRAVADRNKAIDIQRRLDEKRIATEAQYRVLFDAIDAGFCIIKMKFAGEVAVDYQFVEINPAFERHTGLVQAQGRWMREMIPSHEQHWFDVYGGVAKTGEPIRFEFQAKGLEGRWFDVHAFPVGEPNSDLVGLLFNDISVRKDSEILQTVLNHELSHRMKNMMAMVQAVASQTLKSIPDQAPVRAFADRVLALSVAHDLLLQQNWTTADIKDVVSTVVCTFGDSARFEISGPKVLLGSRATLSLSLLVHELTTNALKYGALSDTNTTDGATDGGRVTIGWEIEELDDKPTLRLAWRERGGPEVREPTRKGFGSRLVQMGLAGTGGAEVRYAHDGFEAVFSSSLADLQN